jgi:serine/threonine protein phosphatase PrpC
MTNAGGRAVNEDYVQFIQEENSLCAVLADGLGGHGGGQIASKKAADVIFKWYNETKLTDITQLEDALQDADAAVKSCQTELCEMKTTIVVLRIQDKEAQWAHVGDSRLYHFWDGRLVEQTLDHSVSQMAVLMHEITQEQIRFHEDRSRVLRALGSDSAEPVVSENQDISQGFHAFLLCSDGFWEYIYEQEMEQTLSQAQTPQDWLMHMSQYLKQRASENQDNYSAIAVFVL